MSHDAIPGAQVILRDQSRLLIRRATPADAAAIAEEHPLPREGNVPPLVYRNYYAFKAHQYVRGPGAGIATGWVGDQLAGFVFFSADIAELRAHLLSAPNLRWLLAEALRGRFGYRPAFWLQSMRWVVQHFRQPRDYESPDTKSLPEIRSWIGTVHTVEGFRRLGVATALLTQAEAWLRESGCDSLALWAADDNAPALEAYAKLGYERITRVGRVGEQCWLMLKRLTPADRPVGT